MEILGLKLVIWIVLSLYFVGMLYMGWRSKRGIHDQEGFLLGNRQFGVPMMVMHAFGAGTHPGDVAGVTGKSVSAGASGIWVSWMWMFGTPFYWIIAPIVRRMRCLTLADYFEQRYNRATSMLYVLVVSAGMTIFVASILLATTRTVQGMMGKSGDDSWFFGILFVFTAVFVVYSFWGGIIAAIKTDMLQGLMIIALSFIAIPKALQLAEVGGMDGMRTTLTEHGGAVLSLFDPKSFSLWTIILLCINAPFSMMAQPHLMSVCAAGKTEWEGRVGFTYGNILKRLCTMGWCILGLCWLAYLIKKGNIAPGQAIPQDVADAAFGEAVRSLLKPLLQGVMLACVMAAAMSSGDALQVTIAGLFSQNVYRSYLHPGASEQRLVHVTRIAGLVIIAAALGFAIAMRESIVKTILDGFNFTACVGIAVVLGILWRRMNPTGVFISVIAASIAFLATRYVIAWQQTDLIERGLLTMAEGTRAWTADAGALGWLAQHGFLAWKKEALVSTRLTSTGLLLSSGILGGIIGSLLTKPPRAEVVDKFFAKIYTPIGEEDKLDLPLDEAVPESKRLITAGGLFIVKPTFQSWFGFLVTAVICLAMLGLMYILVTP